VFHWRIAAVVLFVPAAVAAFVGMRISFDDIKSKDGDNPDSMRGAFTETLVDSRRLFTVGFSIAFITVLLYGTYYRGLLTFLPDILGNSSLDDLTILSYSLGPAEYIYTSMLTFGIAGQYAGGKLTDRIPSRTAFLGALSSLVVLALLFILVQGQGFVPLVLVSLALGFFRLRDGTHLSGRHRRARSERESRPPPMASPTWPCSASGPSGQRLPARC